MLKGRGNKTWDDGEKKPYEIKLQAKQSLCGMPGAKKWALLANSFDPTKAKNKLAFDLSKAIGMEYAVDSDWVDLYINGYYWGNYLLCTEPDIGDEGLSIKDLEQENKACSYDPPAFETEDMKGFIYERNPDDISGGYLFQFLQWYQYEKKAFGFILDDEYFALKSPDNASTEEVGYIAAFMEKTDVPLSASPDMDW